MLMLWCWFRVARPIQDLVDLFIPNLLKYLPRHHHQLPACTTSQQPTAFALFFAQISGNVVEQSGLLEVDDGFKCFVVKTCRWSSYKDTRMAFILAPHKHHVHSIGCTSLGPHVLMNLNMTTHKNSLWDMENGVKNEPVRKLISSESPLDALSDRLISRS